jgi:hypothetical protein
MCIDSSYPSSSGGTGRRRGEFSFPWGDWTTDIFKVWILSRLPVIQFFCFPILLIRVAYQARSSAFITCQRCRQDKWPRQHLQGNYGFECSTLEVICLLHHFN